MSRPFPDGGGWRGVDLDGTLAYYDHWISPSHIGPPIPVMQQRVKDWLEKGDQVAIVTARVSNPGQASEASLFLELLLLGLSLGPVTVELVHEDLEGAVDLD